MSCEIDRHHGSKEVAYTFRRTYEKGSRPSRANKSGNECEGGSPFQSLHFANRNPAKSMKTRRERKFNRYTFTVLQSRASREGSPRVTNHGSGGMSHFLSRASSSRPRDSGSSCTLIPRPSCLVPHFGGEEKSNRNNPVFRNRCNSLATKEKTFSNRNKNTYSASPHFRPLPQIHKSQVTSHSRRFGSRATDRGSRITGYGSQVTPEASGHPSLPIPIQTPLLTCRCRGTYWSVCSGIQ
jgi:hypothetical protein